MAEKTKKYFVLNDCYAMKVFRNRGEIVELPADAKVENRNFHDLSKGEPPFAGKKPAAITAKKTKRKGFAEQAAEEDEKQSGGGEPQP